MADSIKQSLHSAGWEINDLTENLKIFIEVITSQLIISNEDNTRAKVKVFEGYLPPRQAKNNDEMPYVVIRPSEGEDADESIITINLLIGTYDEVVSNGYKELINLIQLIKSNLLRKPLLANKYRLIAPLKWEIWDDQPYPQWLGMITLKYNTFLITSQEI